VGLGEPIRLGAPSSCVLYFAAMATTTLEPGATHILLIEDDPAIGESLVDALKANGFRTTWHSTGGDGLAYARSANPHLILLDLRLPDGSGLDYCRQMRQAGLHQPIIILTAQRDEIDKVLGLEMGADDYVTKPFGLRELLSRIRAQLRRAYGEFAPTVADANLLRVGDLTLDLDRSQVRRDETILNLTPTEFKLLVFLARHPGQALSREQILTAVWGYNADVDSERAVNVHISRLRDKVERDPSRPALILTVPSIGYRLVG
jgi:DNA-binding response OmpR family regulator